MIRFKFSWLLLTALCASSAGFYACREDNAVTEVRITPDVTWLKRGVVMQLTVSVLPVNATNDLIIWESDDEDIAAVDDDGLVTALNYGETVIRAVSDDGGFTDSCRVTVASFQGPGKNKSLSVCYGFFQRFLSCNAGSGPFCDDIVEENICIGSNSIHKTLSAE